MEHFKFTNNPLGNKLLVTIEVFYLPREFAQSMNRRAVIINSFHFIQSTSAFPPKDEED